MKAKITFQILLLLSLLLATGCASDAYYQALQAQYEATNPRKDPTHLISHTWTDQSGTTQSLTINQPRCPGDQPQVRPIPAPWEGWYRFYDRTLGAIERNVPLINLLTGGGSRSDSSTTYEFGGNGTVIYTEGDSSGVDYQRDITTQPSEPVEATESTEE